MDITKIVPQIDVPNTDLPPIPMDVPDLREPAGNVTDAVANEPAKVQDSSLWQDMVSAGKRFGMDRDISNADRELSDLANQVRSYGENDVIPQDLMDSYLLQKGIVDDLGEQAAQLNNGKVVQGVSAAYSSAVDTLQDVVKNPTLVGTGALTGLGAAWWTGVGAIPATLAGASIGAGIAGFKENTKRMAGKAYVEMDFAKDDQGEPIYIPNTVKSEVADMVGIVGASVEFGGDLIGAKLLPIFKPLTSLGAKGAGKLVSKAISNESTRKGLIFATGLLKSGSAEAITELSQEVFQDISTSGAEGATDASKLDILLKGFGRVYDKFTANTPEGEALRQKYKDTAIISAIAGGTFHGVGTAASKVAETSVAKATDAAFEAARQESIKAKAAAGEKFNKIKDNIIKSKTKVNTDADGYSNVNPADGTELDYKLQVLEQLDQGQVSLDPKDELALKTQILKEMGTTTLYADPKELESMLNTPVQQRLFKEILAANPDAMVTESKVKLQPEQALTLLKDVKNLRNILTETPEGLTYNEALAMRDDTRARAAQTLGTQEAVGAPTVTADETSLAALSPEAAPTDMSLINEQAPNVGDTKAALVYEQNKLDYIEQLNTERNTILQEQAQGIQNRDQQIRISEIDGMIDSINKWDTELDLAVDETQAIPEGPEITEYEKSEALIKNYVDAPIITNFIKLGLPYSTFVELDKMVKQARTEQADKARVVRDNEYDKVLNSQIYARDVEQTLLDVEDAKNNPDIKIVENFINDRTNNVISLESMTPEQIAKYANDPLLLQRKAFNKKKGNDIETVAAKYGLTSDQLLHVLSVTPDQKTAVKEAQAIRTDLLTQDVYATLDVNMGIVNKYFENVQKLRLEEIKAMSKSSYLKTVRAVESIVAAMPDLKVIKAEVEAQLNNVRVNDLRPEKYRNAAKIANLKALKAANRGDFLLATRLKEVEIRNLEFERQATNTIAKTNLLTKNIIKKAKNDGLNGTLKKAGLYDAMLELSELFNLKAEKGVASEGALLKWAKSIEKQGIGDNPISESLRESYDPRINLNDLSLTQLEALNNLQNKILSDAKAVQKQKQDKRDVMMSEIRESITRELKTNKNYDLGRIRVKSQNEKTTNLRKAIDAVKTVEAGMHNISHTLRYLSEGQLSTKMYDFIYNQLKGLGSYTNSPYGERRRTELMNQIGDHVQQVTEKYGGDKYTEYMNERVSSPYLADTEGLTDVDGTITRYELMMMVAYIGSKNGADRMSNYKMDRGAILLMAEEHLTAQDMQYIQEAVYDTFRLFQPYVKQYMQDLNQAEISFVDGEPMQLFGKTWDGGYVPFFYRNEETISLNANNANDNLGHHIGLENSKDGIYVSTATQSMTSQRNTNNRVKSYGGLLDLNMSHVLARGISEVATDVTMHVPMKNVMDILNDTDVAKDIEAIIGREGIEGLRANVLSAGRNIQGDNVRVLKSLENPLIQRMLKLSANFTANTIVLSGATVMMQMASLPILFKQMGVKGTADFFVMGARMLADRKYRKEVSRIANFEVSTTDYAKQLKGEISEYTDSLPDTNKRTLTQDLGKSIGNFYNVVGFKYMLGGMDSTIKTLSVNAFVNQFMEGNAKDFDYSTLDNKSPEEFYNAAMAYAVTKTLQVVPSASQLETAAIQKGYFKDWARFMGDARNLYSLVNYDLNQIKHDAVDSAKALWALDPVSSGKSLGKLMKRYGYMNAAIAAQYAFIAAVRGYDDGEEVPKFVDDDGNLNTDFFDFMFTKFMSRTLSPMTPIDAITDAIPVVRGIKFTVQAKQNTNGRFAPVVGDMTTIAINNLADAIFVMSKVYADTQNYYDMTGDFEIQMKPSSRKSILKGGASVLPIPYRAIDWVVKQFPEDMELEDITGALSSIPAKMNELTNDAQQMVVDMSDDPDADPEDLEEIQSYIDQVDPQGTAKQNMIDEGKVSAISPDDMNLIAMAESGGNPNAKATGSSAQGLYQFLDSTWSQLMESYPELELTEDGRTDPEQAQRAMDFSVAQYAKRLLQSGVPVNVETIYAAHHFGEGTAARILSKGDDELLPEMTKAREANPWLDGGVSWVNNGEKVKTVGDFKRGIMDLLYTER